LVHRNARLAVAGRLILVRRILAGRPVSHVAKEMGVSRQCAHRWLTRYRDHGEGGLSDRSSRPVSSPSATPPETVAVVVELRSRGRLGRT
jgi:transposase-like protein